MTRKPRLPWLTPIIAVVVIGALVTGCSSTPDAAPNTAITISGTTSTFTFSVSTTSSSTSVTNPSSATPPTTSSSTSKTVPAEASALPLPADNSTVDALNPQEVTDRAAIESVWRKVWDLLAHINEVSVADRPTQVDDLMLDPIRSQLLAGAVQNDAQGLTQYGSIVLHPYWYRAVDGQPYAVIGDCRDASGFGDVEIATGNKRTVGVSASNTVGHFVRIADGSWKLWNVTYVTDLSCTAK